MKRLTQSWTVVTRFAPLFFLVGISLSGTLVFPQSASAYHKTNRPDIERGLRENDGGGWIVLYSKELSQEEETKLSAAIAADALGGSGGFTALYFEEFTRNSVLQVMSEARAKAPQIADTLQRELTVAKLSSAIKASFNGSRVELSIAGTTLQVGRATYNRAECTRIRFGKEDCLSTPNTYQPYIRFRVAASASNQPPIDYEDLTRQLYRQILGREPDPSGFSDNVNAMRQNGFEWVRAGMSGSQESRNNINNLYRQYLCRDADPGGMDFHINLLASGQMALDQIRNGIANGAEAQQHKNGCQ